MQRLFFEILFPSNYFAGKIIKIIKCYEYEIFVRSINQTKILKLIDKWITVDFDFFFMNISSLKF